MPFMLEPCLRCFASLRQRPGLLLLDRFQGGLSRRSGGVPCGFVWDMLEQQWLNGTRVLVPSNLIHMYGDFEGCIPFNLALFGLVNI